MFLDCLRRRNPELIEAAIRFHQEGRIPANCYVIDTDVVERNARIIAAEARRLGLTVFGMTKQMGRNADFCAALIRGGIPATVAVDMECARACLRAGMSLGHIGHLVQVPDAETAAAAAMSPAYWTVFNEERAARAAAASKALGRQQPMLARLQAEGDVFYLGHEGGFTAADVVAVADRIDGLEGARFAGITTFPALLFDQAARQMRTTPNLDTLRRAADALGRAGRTAVQINAPGTNASEGLRLLAEAGATQCEPGHGLTGTTPLHALEDLPELPAVAYVSEVAHRHQGRAYCFGGGLYIDPIFPDYPLRAIVAKAPTVAAEALFSVQIPPPSAIDYYGMIDAPHLANAAVGDTVVFGFRPQIFVTRAYTVGIGGLHDGEPRLGAIFDAFGRAADWPA
jgi:predicted amino acid racemase